MVVLTIEEDILKRLSFLEEKVLELAKGKTLRKKFEHYCPYCQYRWFGYKEVVKECVKCKHRLDPEQVRENIPNKEVCEKLDALVKEHGKVCKISPGLKKNYIFQFKDGKIEFSKEENGVITAPILVDSTYEIMKDWDLNTFFDKRYITYG